MLPIEPVASAVPALSEGAPLEELDGSVGGLSLLPSEVTELLVVPPLSVVEVDGEFATGSELELVELVELLEENREEIAQITTMPANTTCAIRLSAPFEYSCDVYGWLYVCPSLS